MQRPLPEKARLFVQHHARAFARRGLTARPSYARLGQTLARLRFIEGALDADVYPNSVRALAEACPSEPDAIHVTGTGTILCVHGDTVWLAPGGLSSADALAQTVRAYDELRASRLRALVPYALREHAESGVRLVEMDRMDTARPEVADRVLDMLGSEAALSLPAGMPAEIDKAVAYFASALPTTQTFWDACAESLRTRAWHIGPVHGDLTDRNVMTASGAPAMIDLDRFRWRAPHALDRIHLSVSRRSVASRVQWPVLVAEEWTAATTPAMHRADLALYFLFRVGVESGRAVAAPRDWHRLVQAAAERVALSPASMAA